MRHLSRIFVTLAAVAVGYTAHAQSLPLTETSTDDIQARFCGALEVPIGKKFAFQWSEEVRLNNNWGSVDKVLSGLGMEYEPLKYLKAGVEYIFVNDNDLEDGWGIKHRRPVHHAALAPEGGIRHTAFALEALCLCGTVYHAQRPRAGRRLQDGRPLPRQLYQPHSVGIGRKIQDKQP